MRVCKSACGWGGGRTHEAKGNVTQSVQHRARRTHTHSLASGAGRDDCTRATRRERGDAEGRSGKVAGRDANAPRCANTAAARTRHRTHPGPVLRRCVPVYDRGCAGVACEGGRRGQQGEPRRSCNRGQEAHGARAGAADGRGGGVWAGHFWEQKQQAHDARGRVGRVGHTDRQHCRPLLVHLPRDGCGAVTRQAQKHK